MLEKRALKEIKSSIQIPDFKNSKKFKKKLKYLAKLEKWQERSAKTKWVIGDFLRTK